MYYKNNHVNNKEIKLSNFFLALYFFSNFLISATLLVPDEYSTIHLAIFAASTADTILVAPGSYVENIDFSGKNIIVASHFILDNDTSHITNTIIDGSQGTEFPPVVAFLLGENSSAELIGFTITNGIGGGISCSNSNPNLKNLVITQNSYGGLNFSSSSPSVTNAIVSNNSGGGINLTYSNSTFTNISVTDNLGSGINCDYSDPILSYVTISANTSYSNGAGLYCHDSNPSLTHVTISNNIVWGGDGGGIYCYLSSPSIENATITNNSSSGGNGGGIYANEYSWITMTNVLISGNGTNTGKGGGIYSINHSDITLRNVTISNNSAGDDGGGIYFFNPSNGFPDLRNSIVWDNYPDQLWQSGAAYPVIQYSDIQGGWGGQGNIDVNPMFCDPEEGDFSVCSDSPVLGSGEDGADMGAFGSGCGPCDQNPIIIISEGYLHHDFGTVVEGSSPDPSFYTFTVENAGTGTLVGNIEESVSWLSINPTSFSLESGQTQVITVNSSTSDLPVGDYSTTFVISSNSNNQYGTVQVSVISDSPSISSIENQSTDEDTPTSSISFTVGDFDTDLNQLLITGSSTDTMLVSESGIQFSGTGSDRAVVVTPIENQHGSTYITIYVDDESGEPPTPGDTLSTGFETGSLPPGWTSIDHDGDGYNWYIYQSSDLAHSGEYSAFSNSYINNVGALTPNNWLITPSLSIGDNMEVQYWIAAQDPNWPQEHYSVKVSTSGAAVADFTETLFSETLSDGDWHEVVLDLSSFSGSNVHIAWQHHDLTDMYIIKLDDIQVMNTTTRDIVYQNDFEQVDELTLIPSVIMRKRSSRDIVSTTFELTVNPLNDTPTVFALDDLANISITVDNVSTDSLIFIWEESEDVDGDELSYNVSLSFTINGAAGPVTEERDTTVIDTLFAVVDFQSLYNSFYADGATTADVEWNVVVSDGQIEVSSENGPLTVHIDASTLSIEENLIPGVFALHQNYPNPFNPTSTIRYDLPKQSYVAIIIYDIMGRDVKRLVSQSQDAGFKSVVWDATNDLGQPVSAGIYLYRIRAGEFVHTKKMLLIK